MVLYQICVFGNKNLVYDHPVNISAKFGSNLFCGFRKKDENVKLYGKYRRKIS
jgi:hypothetical protein